MAVGDVSQYVLRIDYQNNGRVHNSGFYPDNGDAAGVEQGYPANLATITFLAAGIMEAMRNVCQLDTSFIGWRLVKKGLGRVATGIFVGSPVGTLAATSEDLVSRSSTICLTGFSNGLATVPGSNVNPRIFVGHDAYTKNRGNRVQFADLPAGDLRDSMEALRAGLQAQNIKDNNQRGVVWSNYYSPQFHSYLQRKAGY